MRQRKRQAVRISKAEQRRRCCGRMRRMADTSCGPKKNERCDMSSSGMIVFLVSATSSYSWCVHVTRGGSRALRTCLSHTGGTVGARKPRASSPTADMNWTRPAASPIVWLSRRAKIKPPHFRRVTCQFICAIYYYTKFNYALKKKRKKNEAVQKFSESGI